VAIVYIHRRCDIKDNFKNVFYVGIGKSEKRAGQINHSRNPHWKNIYNKYNCVTEITHKNISWEEACSIEKYLISFYGRKDLKLGSLCNMTDGGDGVLVWSEELIKNHSLIQKKVQGTSESRKKNSETQKKLFENKDYKIKHTKRLLEAATSTEGRLANSKRKIKYYSNIQNRVKHSKIMKETLLNRPELNEQNRKRALLQWTDEAKKRMSEIKKNYYINKKNKEYENLSSHKQ
jgi:hypothetical protein